MEKTDYVFKHVISPLETPYIIVSGLTFMIQFLFEEENEMNKKADFNNEIFKCYFKREGKSRFRDVWKNKQKI